MTDIFSSLASWVPYLNTGIIVLVLGLIFEKLGFRITRKEFKRKPWPSLFWGLSLVFVSSLISIIIEAEMSGFQPLLAFIILILAYLVLTQLS